MNIVFGSTSTDKLSILKKSLDGKLPLWSIEGVEVESGISDQPLSIEETEKGAINRAKAALKAKPQANLAVGLEGGLEDRNGIYWLIGVAAFWDGHQLVVEKGKQLPLPHVVSQKIKQGGQFGQLIREYQLTAEPHEQERIDQLISRELVLASAIKKALSRYRQSKSMSIVSEISALFASDSGPELLFKISAVLIGLFFALRAIIAVASPILGLMQMLQPWFDFAGFSQLVSLLIVPGLAAFTLGIWRLRSKLSLN